MGVGGRVDVIENNEHLSHSSIEESEENVISTVISAQEYQKL